MVTERVSRLRIFRSANFPIGAKVGDAHIHVGVPSYLKKMVRDFCQENRVSMNRYMVNLILADLRPKIKKLDDYIKEIERVAEVESKL